MIKLNDKTKNVGIVLFLVVSIAFAEWRKSTLVCTQISLQISNQDGNKFIDLQDVNDLVSDFGTRPVVGGKLIHTSLKTIEVAVKNNNFVERVGVAKNHAGVLKIHVSQTVPIARVFTKDSSFYLTRTGAVIPLSNKYTSRVLLVRGLGGKNFLKGMENKDSKIHEFLSFFDYIDKDDFLRKQVAEVHVKEDGDITIFPQVTKQIIEFGEPIRIVDKFERLKIFYKKVLPEKGWNHYDRVNLKYKNQIICS